MEFTLTAEVIWYSLLGTLLGTFVGVLPGVGAIAAISLLLPITYYISPAAAIIMLSGIYYGAQYGGSTASILLNVPGTMSSAVTCQDGYPLTKQGKAGVALFITAVASFVGAIIGIVILLVFSPVLADIGIRFGPAEYAAMMLLGLIAVAVTASEDAVKQLAMIILGLLLGTIGTDINSGVVRFDFGLLALMDNLSLIAVSLGLFGVAELIASISNPDIFSNRSAKKITFRSMLPAQSELKESIAPTLRGSGVGSFFGALPGTGPTISSLMSYILEKNLSKKPEQFGKGAIAGIAGPEAANNAAAQTAFVPTLSLGIPGDATMAIILGALIMHGVTPGPLMISQHPNLFWGLIASFFIGNIMLLILNLPMINIWVKMLQIPYRLMYPAILLFVCIGAYSINNNPIDIIIVAVIGFAAVLLNYTGFKMIPILMGFVLGSAIEEHLRRALLLSGGNLMTFVERPISAAFILASATLLGWAAWRWYKKVKI